MTIRQKINKKLQNDPNLVEIGIYKTDGRRHGILYDKANNRIVVIEDSKDLIGEDDLPEPSENGYDLNQHGLKELFNDILEDINE